MVPDDKQSLDEWRLQARKSVRTFYQALERLLKRHQPIAYASAAARRLLAAGDDIEKLRRAPPHRILHSIEANCAYARGQNHDPVGPYRLNKVLNVYHSFADPLQLRVVGESVQHLMLIMNRQQLELQYKHSGYDLARAQRLFISDTPMPRCAQEFLSEHGLTMEEWCQLSFLYSAVAQEAQGRCFPRAQLWRELPIRFKGSEECSEAFIRMSSQTPDQIRTTYRELRSKVALEYHTLIRSVFLSKPIIDFGEAGLLAPLPQLLLRNSWAGIYQAVREMAPFGKEFGDSFQAYVEQLLDCDEQKQRVLASKDLERHTSRRSCDFLVERPDEMILIETKAATFSHDFLTEKAILDDNSTIKVAEGMEQIYGTAYDIGEGALAPLSIRSDKPLLGIVVTFGDLFIPNSKWYFEKFILEKAKDKLSAPIYPNEALDRPIVLSIQALERFVEYLNTSGTRALDLRKEKDQQEFALVGDWDVYLKNKLNSCTEPIKHLPIMRREFDDFFQQMGLQGWDDRDRQEDN